MKLDTNSIAHTKWECKYHIVFAGNSCLLFVGVFRSARFIFHGGAYQRILGEFFEFLGKIGFFKLRCLGQVLQGNVLVEILPAIMQNRLHDRLRERCFAGISLHDPEQKKDQLPEAGFHQLLLIGSGILRFTNDPLQQLLQLPGGILHHRGQPGSLLLEAGIRENEFQFNGSQGGRIGTEAVADPRRGQIQE